MVNKRFLLGILVMVLVFGVTVVGCDNDPDNGNGGENGSGGLFALTNIPSEHNGKYVHLASSSADVQLFGDQSVNMATGTIVPSRISNGSVSIPMWIVTGGTVNRYSGNHTVSIAIAIINSATVSGDVLNSGLTITFESVTFSNGSATKSFNEASSH